MSEWKKVKLGEICEITSSKRIFFSEYVDSGIPFYRSKEIIELSQGLSISEPLYISEIRYNEIKQRFGVPETNDILLTSVGSIGIPYIVNKTDKFYFKDGNLTWFRNYKDSVFPPYVLYWLRSNDCFNILNNIALGAAQKALTIVKLKEVEIPLPPLPTQHRIATILSRYDSLIENYQKQIKLLEEAAQRLYKEWFVELRFPGHENTKMVDGLPEGWERKKLGELTSKFATGLNPRKNFVLGRGNNYYVTIKNMSNNDVVFDEKCDKVDDEALEKINKRSDLQMGDLLFSGIGTIGRVYLIDKPVTNWNISESVFTMRPRPDIPSSFLYLVLLDKEIQDYCQSNAHGCAQKGIRMADLKAFEVLVPPQPILDAFNNVTSNLIKQAKSKSTQIRLLTEARDRLLPRLMSGELDVKTQIK